LVSPRLDELAAELEDAPDLRRTVGDVDVEVDRQLDRRRLVALVEEELRPVAACEVAFDRVAGEEAGPERREPPRVFARERDVVEAEHAGSLTKREGRPEPPLTRLLVAPSLAPLAVAAAASAAASPTPLAIAARPLLR